MSVTTAKCPRSSPSNVCETDPGSLFSCLSCACALSSRA